MNASSALAAARRLARIQGAPAPGPGFAGPGHTAVEVLQPNDLPASDPFVLLMDDRLDFPAGKSVGGAHPHAGLETVTLVLEGSIRDRDEGLLEAGDAVWMTAGSGIIHNESAEATGRARILQLWLTLPKAERWTAPRFEVIRRSTLPVHRAPGVEVRLYSGRAAGLGSPTKNHVPVTLVHVSLARGASYEQALPASYNGFVYVLEGSLVAGSDRRALARGDVGWLDRASGTGESRLEFTAGEEGAVLVLYAGEPQREPLIQHGPFVAGSKEDIVRLYAEFRAGRFRSMSAIAREAHLAPETT